MVNVDLLEELRVPEEYVRIENNSDIETHRALATWKSRALQVLQLLSNVFDYEIGLRHLAIMRLAIFDGEDIFSSETHRSLATTCLAHVLVDSSGTPLAADQRQSLLRDVLQHGIKPLFLSSLHPSVNIGTGRKLPEPAGGFSARYDMYDDQEWKTKGLGSWNVLRWCIAHTELDDFEILWPLLIPPLMTLLDDHDPAFKLQGIKVAHELIRRVDAGLLRRTGISSLIFLSLETALTFHTSIYGPQLIVAASSVYLALVEKTMHPDSQERFDKLCSLISDAIIGGVWVYVYRGSGDKEKDTYTVSIIEASVQVLPPVIRALGIGSVRFLKAMVPQLVDYLITKPYLPRTPRLELLSSDCLAVIIRECYPRINAETWGSLVFDGLLRCWVEVTELGQEEDNEMEDFLLQESLKELAKELVKTCPEFKKQEIPRLLELDRTRFEELFEIGEETDA